MDLYEYQAKELFATHGVTTQVGKVVSTPEDAQKAAAEFNCAVVVKAQRYLVLLPLEFLILLEHYYHLDEPQLVFVHSLILLLNQSS